MKTLLMALAALILLPGLAEAHPGTALLGGFGSGVLHPLTGADHVAAMVAVGLWAALIGGAATWALPLCFPLVMVLGGMLGAAHVALPVPETMIALSVAALGLAVAFAWRAPLALATALVAAFALFHGHAHGTELPDTASPALYALGFVAATALLHAAGLALGTAARRAAAGTLVRGMGAAIAAAGLVFLLAP